MANMGNAVGKVTFIKGRVLAHAQDGSTRVLKEGDLVYEGEVLLAGPEGYIELQFDNGRSYSAGAKQVLTLDETVIGSDLPESRDAALLAEAKDTADIERAIAQGGSLDALLEETAAGLGGVAGSMQEGHGFVQLLRIVESLTPAHYEFGTERTPVTAATTGYPGNAPPVAVADAATTDEDTPIRIAVRANDSDPEHDPLTVVAVTQGSHGTVVIDPATGDPVYTPAPNWNGVDTFTYTIGDGHGGTATATVTVTVNPVNDAPVAGTIAVAPDGTTTLDPDSIGAGNYQHTIPEDTSASGRVRATDVDGDTLAFSQASKPAHGVAVVNPDGSYTYTPSHDYNGTDSFTVLVSDGHGGTVLSTVDIVITPVQDPSVITPGFGSVTEDVVLTTSGRLSITDVDGPQDEHFVPQANVAGAHGSFSIDADGNWIYNLNNADPAVQALGAGQSMTEVFAVTGVDGTPSTVTVTINGVDENRPPRAGDDFAATPRNAPVTIDVLSNDRDPDGDPLSISNFGQAGHGTVALVGGKLVYTPSTGFTGTDTFQYSVSDGKGGTDTATVTVTVGSPAVNPVAVNDSSIGNAVGMPVRVDVLANDSDADGTLVPSTVRIVGTANAGDPLAVAGQGTWTVDPSTGAITFTPLTSFTGDPSPIQYIVRDNDGNPSAPATVTVDYAAPLAVAVTSVSSPIVNEGGNLDFTVTLSNTSTTPTVVALTPHSGTATLGTDTGTPIQVSFDGGTTWSTVSGPSVTVPAGGSSFIVRIPTIQDGISEPNETLTLDAATAQNATPVTGTGTILDGSLPTVSIAGPADVNEAAGTLTYTVSLSNASAAPITVDVATANGTATAGTDYTALNQTLTFAAGQTSKTVTVAITNDTVYEGAENYQVKLSNASGANIATGSVTTTIHDDGTGTVPPGTTPDDDRPKVASVSSPSIGEGGNLDFTVTLSNTSTTPTVVALTPHSGTATLGTDTGTPIQVSFDGGTTWSTVSGPSVTVPAGGSSFIVRIPTVLDNISEPNETLTLDAATAQNAVPVTGTGTILDGSLPTLLVSNVSVTEGTDAYAVFNVGLSNPSTQAVSVALTMANGTALGGGVDYGSINGTNLQVSTDGGVTWLTASSATIAAGTTGILARTPITNDTLYENTENFTLTATRTAGATTNASATGTGTIVDNDPPPSFAINDVTVNEAAGTATFTVTLSAASGLTSTVDWNLTNGTAQAGTDYTAASGTLTFNPGVTTQTITVAILNDTPPVYEGAETFNVNLSNATNATVADALGLGTIKDDGTGYVPPGVTPDDDRPRVASVVGDTVAEGSPNTFVVTLSNLSTSATSVSLALASGTATVGTDTGTPLQASFDNGATWSNVVGMAVAVPANTGSFLVRVPTTNDTTYEGNETYTLAASTAQNAAPMAGTGTITDLQDIVVATSASVSEEGLPGGIPDTLGTVDTTNSASASGQLWNAALPSAPLTATLSIVDPGLTTGGKAVTWTGSGTNTLIGSATGVGEVIRVSIDNSGHYSVTLSKPIDHATAGVEDVKSFGVTMNVSDGVATKSATLTVNVEDDAPYLGSQHQAVTLPPQDTNLMIVLDISGSMATNVTIGGTTMTRLAAAVQAINTLLDGYDALGNVAVRIVTFSTNANAHGAAWETVASARTYLASLTANGGTNYDEALGDAMAAFSSAGKIVGAQNVSYFMTDGLPTYGSGTTSTLVGTSPDSISPTPNGTGSTQAGTDTGIQSAEETTWTTFLNNNDVKSYAVAMGGPYNSTNSYDGLTHTSQYYIDPIAYDGTGAGTNTNGVIVTDWNALSTTLTATVSASVAGQILSGNALGTNWGIGADGGYLQSVGIDGNTFTFDRATGAIAATGGSYTYDAATHVVTVNTAHGGILAIDMDNGDYTYRSSGVVTNPYSEVLTATLRDNDGDTASGTLTLDVARAMGGPGNDVIVGTPDIDVIIGGRGSDTMTGGAGADTFRWVLGDAAGAPTDTITDFNTAAPAAGGDVLDLRDLLVGESHVGNDAGNLANYLHFGYSGGTNSTTISVTTHDATSATQTIVLQGVNLTTLGANDTAIIQALLTNNKLIVD